MLQPSHVWLRTNWWQSCLCRACSSTEGMSTQSTLCRVSNGAGGASVWDIYCPIACWLHCEALIAGFWWFKVVAKNQSLWQRPSVLLSFRAWKTWAEDHETELHLHDIAWYCSGWSRIAVARGDRKRERVLESAVRKRVLHCFATGSCLVLSPCFNSFSCSFSNLDRMILFLLLSVPHSWAPRKPLRETENTEYRIFI